MERFAGPIRSTTTRSSFKVTKAEAQRSFIYTIYSVPLAYQRTMRQPRPALIGILLLACDYVCAQSSTSILGSATTSSTNTAEQTVAPIYVLSAAEDQGIYFRERGNFMASIITAVRRRPD